MKEVNGRIKAFIETYIPMAKANQEQKEEIDALNEEIEEIYRVDREKEAKRLEGIKKASGIELPPEPIKDARYIAKTRQKADMQEQYDKDTKALKMLVSEVKNKAQEDIRKKEQELKDTETKYLANVQEKLRIAEQKIALGGSEEQMDLFRAEREEMSEALENVKQTSKAKVEEIDHLYFFVQTISDVENGKYDLEKLEKAIENLETMDTLAEAKKAMKGAAVKKPKTQEEPPKPGEEEPPKPGAGESPKPEQEPPKPGAGEPPKPGQEPPKPGAGEPPKPEQEPPKPGAGEPPKPEQEPPKPGAGEPPKPGEEPPKPEGAVTSIRYSAIENKYELTFENGATMPYKIEDKALREFKKEDKRYLKELLPGIGAYKKCDIGLFKALRELDRTNGTHNFDAYIALLNGEESTLENITYDAEKMNDPVAFNKQEPEARRVMTRMMRRVRNLDGVDVIGLKRTRFQKFVDFFTGAKSPKQITGNKPRVVVGEETPERTDVKVHPMIEVAEGDIQRTDVKVHPMSNAEAMEVRKAFGNRRSQKGREWAESIRAGGEPPKGGEGPDLEDEIKKAKQFREDQDREEQDQEQHGDEEI